MTVESMLESDQRNNFEEQKRTNISSGSRMSEPPALTLNRSDHMHKKGSFHNKKGKDKNGKEKSGGCC